MDLHVGLGDYKISAREGDILRTYALASCVAVTVYSPSRKVAGMVHVVLPEPGGDTADFNPAYYATTGVPLLIHKMCRDYGCVKDELQVRLYGGADSINGNDIFKIGKRNLHAVSKTLERLNLSVSKAETGGRISRTLTMNVAKGEVEVRHQPIGI